MEFFNILALTSADQACDSVSLILRVIGYVVFFLKVAVVIVLIVIGTLDFFKASMEKDEKTMKEAQKKLITRLITAGLVYFVLPIVSFLMQIVGFEDYKACMDCINHPFSCEVVDDFD